LATTARAAVQWTSGATSSCSMCRRGRCRRWRASSGVRVGSRPAWCSAVERRQVARSASSPRARGRGPHARVRRGRARDDTRRVASLGRDGRTARQLWLSWDGPVAVPRAAPSTPSCGSRPETYPERALPTPLAAMPLDDPLSPVPVCRVPGCSRVLTPSQIKNKAQVCSVRCRVRAFRHRSNAPMRSKRDSRRLRRRLPRGVRNWRRCGRRSRTNDSNPQVAISSRRNPREAPVPAAFVLR
jgi:hypothetical protein